MLFGAQGNHGLISSIFWDYFLGNIVFGGRDFGNSVLWR